MIPGERIMVTRLDSKYRRFLKHGFKVRVDNQLTIKARLQRKFMTRSGGRVLFLAICDPKVVKYVYLFANETLYDEISAEDLYTISYCECLIMSYERITNASEKIVCYPKDGFENNTTFYYVFEYEQWNQWYSEREVVKSIKKKSKIKQSFIDRMRDKYSNIRFSEYKNNWNRIDVETTVEVMPLHKKDEPEDDEIIEPQEQEEM